MSFAKLAVPVALGLSLATVTAFVVYYMFKKDEDETKEHSIKTSRLNVIEVQVAKSIVPALIGRQGSTIKDLEKKTGATINCKKFTDKDYDVFIIRGRSEATQLAETLIHEFIKEQPVFAEDAMLVPSWACGRIIGSGGDNINDISHRSGARIKVEGGAEQGSTRSITFRGTREQIAVARGLIDSCVSQEKCRREIEQSKRSPRTAAAAAAASPPPPARAADAEPTAMPGDKHATKKSEASGSVIEVYVSAVSSPSRFWVQFVGAQVSQLDSLVEEMTDYYGHAANREAHALRQVTVGQIVAAVFRNDGRWYRARVADIRPNEFDATKQVADVFFVDYGDSEYVATHELCELRADLLRLRFQAMECFLAGVRPVGAEGDTEVVCEDGQRWDRWQAPAVERFEDLAQVARWKPLESKTITYKKTATADDEKEKEIPGIKLFDVTEEGEVDIAATLIAEGWALPAGSPRASPARPPPLPFGDLTNSRILGLLSDRNERSSSLPKDHERTDHAIDHNGTATKEEPKMPSSKSLGSGLESSASTPQAGPADLTHAEASRAPQTPQTPQTPHNGSHDDFLHAERQHVDKEASTETLVPNKMREQLKANMNRIDSHHASLEALSRTHQDL